VTSGISGVRSQVFSAAASFEDPGISRMAVFDHPQFDDHLQVTFFDEPAVGLRAITAIHTLSVIGTSGGGCRMMPYPNDDAALHDVLRLSRAMSYKLALADVPAGGAKTVVIGDPARDKTEPLLRALGRAIHRLGGKYVIGEDVGTTREDMEVIGKETPFVVGKMTGGGETTKATAHGVFAGLRMTVQRRLARDLEGILVAVQGVGGVGYELCKQLHAAGARIVVADAHPERVELARRELGASAVDVDEIYDADVDVFAPCALGSVLDERTIPRLRCKVIAGAANNQLADDRCGRMLADREILYAPDFVVNAGAAVGAVQGRKPEAEVFAKTAAKVEALLEEVFDRAERERRDPNEAAVIMAKERLARRRR
jgi:leucine dehydrogenase